MHIVFEGIVPRELCLIPKQLIADKVLNRAELNDLIQNFNYHPMIESTRHPKKFQVVHRSTV